jgi:hypothetical protein
MPFSSMIQEMKGEIGAISSRGLLRFWSSGAAGRAPAATEPDEALRESCWAQVPPELLRMVLAKVEDEEARWPGRSAVVASAGVCRCWRAVVKEMVRVPEESGKFTFPISLKQVNLFPLPPRTLNLYYVFVIGLVHWKKLFVSPDFFHLE